MKKVFALGFLALTLAPSAHAAGQTLLVCRIMGGGEVSIVSTSSNKSVDLVMDGTAQSELAGVREARGLDATMESNDPGSIAGPIDLIEIGRGFNGSEGDCGFGLQLNTNNQRVGRDRDVALKPSYSYNKVECRGAKAEIESCTLGAALRQVSDLKNFIHTEVAD